MRLVSRSTNIRASRVDGPSIQRRPRKRRLSDVRQGRRPPWKKRTRERDGCRSPAGSNPAPRIRTGAALPGAAPLPCSGAGKEAGIPVRPPAWPGGYPAHSTNRPVREEGGPSGPSAGRDEEGPGVHDPDPGGLEGDEAQGSPLARPPPHAAGGVGPVQATEHMRQVRWGDSAPVAPGRTRLSSACTRLRPRRPRGSPRR